MARSGRRGCLEGLAVRDLPNCSSSPRMSYQLLRWQQECFLVLQSSSTPERGWFTVCPRAGWSTRTERLEQAGAAGIRQKKSAIERRSPTRLAAYDILPSEDAATAEPDAVNLPGRTSQTAVGKNELNVAAVG